MIPFTCQLFHILNVYMNLLLHKDPNTNKIMQCKSSGVLTCFSVAVSSMYRHPAAATGTCLRSPQQR